jgi:hypothetical protein
MPKSGLKVFGGLCVALYSLPVDAAPVCLRQPDMVSTTSADGKMLTVTMRDGAVWVNKLQTPCPGLRFDGFSWVLHQPALICDDSQALQVLNSGEVCALGKFILQHPGRP